MSLYSEYRARYPELLHCLENASASGRLSHAFLVHAPSAKTRREFPVVLAQIAGCREGKNGVPDTNCSYCTKLEQGLYPDFHVLSPVGKKFQIKVGDRVNPEPNTMRNFLERFYYTSGKYRKIGVIQEADRMNDETQNALLKTLEEPPSDTTLILVTANPSALLPTTRSRCQLLPLPESRCTFDFAGAKDVFAALGALCFSCANDLIGTEEAAQTLIRVAGELAAAAEAQADEEFNDRLAGAARAEDPALMKRMEERRADAASGDYMRERAQFMGAVTSFCSEVYLLSCGIACEALPNPELFDGIALPETISPPRGEKILHEAEELEYTLRFNVNEALALRAFAMNLAMN